MIRINLLPESKRTKKTKRRGPGISPVAVILGIIQILIVLVIILIVHTRLDQKLTRLNLDIEKINDNLQKLNAPINQIKAFEEKKKNLLHKLEIIDNLKKAQQGPVHMMDDLSNSIPDKVWIKTIAITGNIMEMTGTTIDPSLVADFMVNLEKSPYFKNPGLKDIQAGGKYDDMETHNFRMQVEVIQVIKKDDVLKES
jgi:type IV pilus assembly protein PilN